MSKPYCGINEIPKDHRRGTLAECAEKGQLRYYGLKKYDEKELVKVKDDLALPAKRRKLMKQYFSLKGLINRYKGRYETTKDKEKKEEYYALWKKAEKEINIVIPKLKKIEEQREAAKLKKIKENEKDRKNNKKITKKSGSKKSQKKVVKLK